MPTHSLTPLFYRRLDLTSQIRMRIATMVLYFSSPGLVLRLSNKYSVTPQFIYNLRTELAELGEKTFGTKSKEPRLWSKEESLRYLLPLRLEGKSAIEGISTLMKRFGIKYNSVGFISQELERIGQVQGNILGLPMSGVRVVLCSDEIFAKQQAILLTVDPVSLAILHIELSINRKGETWAAHWKGILEEGYEPLYLCNDEGLGMSSGQATALEGLERQSDTFHAVAHRLGAWVERLEKKALTSIEAEYECERLVDTAKTEATWEKRYANYETAQKKAKADIEQFDSFTFLYHCLLSAFDIFDAKGALKDSDKVLSDFNLALDLMHSMGHAQINKELKSIEACKTDLFHFLSVANKTVSHLKDSVPPNILKILCLAWQTHKKSIKAKLSDRKNALKTKEALLLKSIPFLDKDAFDTGDRETQAREFKEIVYRQLSQIIQSSAAVECVNSILRPYLNTSKNQVTQSGLNLFMAYHNHRRFKAGERKGRTPFEILTGHTQDEDWLDRMLRKAA